MRQVRLSSLRYGLRMNLMPRSVFVCFMIVGFRRLGVVPIF